ncbi:MAG: FecR family protein [Spirochaetia bacterium]|nr:FecR family protein [Spirochaetia bacterium]
MLRANLLLILSVAVLFTCQRTESRLSRITFARGEIYLIRQGSSPVPIEAGAILQHKDTLRTGKDSYAEVMVQNVGLFRLSENSELNMEELQANDKTIIRLDKGKAGFFLLKLIPNQQVGVKLPTAVAGVRGTKFLVAADGASKVALFGGAVQVENEQKQSVVIDKPGEVKLKKGEAIDKSSLKPLSAESIADMKKLEELLPLDLQKVPVDPGRPAEFRAPSGSDLKKP